MATLVTDTFNRANENPLASPWVEIPGTEVAGSFQLVSNTAQPTAVNLLVGMYYDGGIAWPNNQWAEIDITTINSTSRGLGPCVRCSNSVGTFYGVQYRNDSLLLYKVVNDVFTSLGGGADTLADIATIRIEALGDQIRCYVDGVLKLSATDSSIASGNPGMRAYLNTGGTTADATIDTFRAGNFSPVLIRGPLQPYSRGKL